MWKINGEKGIEKNCAPAEIQVKKKRERENRSTLSKKIYNESYIFTCLFPGVIIYPFILSLSLSLTFSTQAYSKRMWNIIIIFPTFQRLKLSVKLLLNVENGFNYLNQARNARRCLDHYRYFSLKLKIFFSRRGKKMMESSLVAAGHSIRSVEIRISRKIVD